MPFIGSWTTDIGRAGDPELMCVAYGSFIPNFIYQSGLAENLVLWGVARARWAREILRPNVVDLPMHEILSRRGDLGVAYERGKGVRQDYVEAQAMDPPDS
jgi:hypothetical protein